MLNKCFLFSLFQPVYYTTEREIYRLVQPCNSITINSQFLAEKAACHLTLIETSSH